LIYELLNTQPIERRHQALNRECCALQLARIALTVGLAQIHKPGNFRQLEEHHSNHHGTAPSFYRL
jgi:hypothetical protein